jgi:hypothetical protein
MVLRSTALAAAISLAAIGWAAPVAAQSNLRQLFAKPGAGRVAAPPVAKYVADDREFVLDRSGPNALLRFANQGEVWALKPSPGPRGDVIYRDDTGRPVLRATRLGGLTVFPPDRPSGLPAALAGDAEALKPAALSPGRLLQRVAQASYRASRAAGHLIPFEFVPDATQATAAYFADAAAVAAEGVVRAAGRRKGRATLSRLRKVEFDTGRQPGVAVTGEELAITIAPQHGLAGRPSSERIAEALGGN